MKATIKLLPLGMLLGLLVAACGTTPQTSEEIGKQLEAASELSQNIAQIQGVLVQTAGQLSELEAGIGSAEDEVTGFVAGAEVHALGRVSGIADPPDGQVAMRMSFTYLPAALPGDGIQAYESTDEVNTLWAMESLAAGAALPVGELIPEGTLFFEPGEEKTVTLAYSNPSSEAVSFLVMPHQESPGSSGAYVWPTCLCMSFAYEAPADGAWYRVIKITMSPEAPPGSKIDSLWTVLTDPSVFPEE